eukprot:6203941-Pleurochrysis_carterae.AAC.5
MHARACVRFYAHVLIVDCANKEAELCRSSHVLTGRPSPILSLSATACPPTCSKPVKMARAAQAANCCIRSRERVGSGEIGDAD